jgi:serine/threonine-protein kinase
MLRRRLDPRPMTNDGALHPAPANAQPELVGSFRLASELGRGGMGVVYRARDERSGAEVALKVLPPHLHEDGAARARLLREARAVAALDHPNVCALLDAGETDGGAVYLAMPLYDGETLEARLARGPLPVGEAAELGRQLAQGLTAAHAAGIVHRDIKPSNIQLGKDGMARLMDFGVARLEGATRTNSGGGSGTLLYSSPEQIQDRAEVASDLWALGVVLYEAIGGRRPFRGRYEAALLYAILHGAPESLRRHRPDVPDAIEAVVLRCLEKRPEDRFPSAEALERALGAALEGERPSSRRVRRRLAFSGSLPARGHSAGRSRRAIAARRPLSPTRPAPRRSSALLNTRP